MHYMIRCLLFISFICFTIDVSGQEEIFNYQVISSFETGRVNDLISLNADLVVAATDAGLWIFSYLGDEPYFMETSLPVTKVYFLYPEPLEIFAVYTNNTIGRWNLESRTEIAHFTGHSDKITVAKVFAGILITGSADGTVRLWSLEDSNQSEIIYTHESAVNGIEILTGLEEHILASSSGNMVHLWLFWRKQERGVLYFDSDVSTIGVEGASVTLVVGTVSGNIHIWNHLATQASFEYEGETYPLFEVPLADGSQAQLAMVESGRSESVFIDPENPSGDAIEWQGNWRGLEGVLNPFEDVREIAVIDAHDSAVRELRFPRDENGPMRLFSLAEDKSVYTGDFAGEALFSRTNSDVEIIILEGFPPEYFASLDASNNVSFWSMITGTEIGRLLNNSERITHITIRGIFWLATATESGFVQIWEWSE